MNALCGLYLTLSLRFAVFDDNVNVIDLRFSWLEFTVHLRFSGIMHVEC